MNDAQLRLEPLVYSVTEAAEVLQVSRSTVFELIHSRQLASFTIGRRRLVTRADVVDFIAYRRELAR
ncbi:MAG: helix-turn-helix domain-containing protein [Actinomycetota bacterium]